MARGEKINPNNVAKRIQIGETYLFSAQRFYCYQNGIFRSIGDNQIKSIIKKELGAHSRSYLINEVYTALSLDVNCEPQFLNLSGLNVQNGMLDLSKMTLASHDPIYKSTTQLNVYFTPDAECPLFLETVNEWLGSKEKVELLQEFIGYCLTFDTFQEKILFLVGSGANGKSTLLHVIGSIFGVDNTSAIPLDKLSNRFYLAELFGKLINITSETPSKSVLCDDVIKSVVSGDLIQAERKFKEPFFFKPNAKFIVACNEIPRTEDKTDALYRRLLILRFDRTYTEEEQDKTLKGKLIQEKNGIFNWALEGLKRLRERTYFNEPQESTEERESYRKENNTLLSFVEEECELCDQGTTSKNEFYKKYEMWCKESGLHSLSKPRLGKALREHFKVGEEFEGSAYNRCRIWTGIVLRNQV